MNLILRPDLYTRRHTQWYYFRVQNMIANITYRFRIINLVKKTVVFIVKVNNVVS